MYQVVDNVVFLSMSADASCRGLLTAVDGPLVMELTGSYSTAATGCQFPAWFRHSTWQDMTGRHQYYVHDDGPLTYALSRKMHKTWENGVVAKYHCVRQFEDTRDETQSELFSRAVVVLTKVLYDW